MLLYYIHPPRECLCHDDTVWYNCTGLTSQRLYAQVVNIPNSMTVLPELLPYSVEMVRSLLLELLQHCCGAADRQ